MKRRNPTDQEGGLPRGAGSLTREELIVFAVRTVLDDVVPGASAGKEPAPHGFDAWLPRLAPGIRAVLE